MCFHRNCNMSESFFFVFMIANLYLLYYYFCVILQGMGMIDKDITSLHTLCRQFDVSVQLHTITEVMSFLVHLSQHLLQRTGNFVLLFSHCLMIITIINCRYHGNDKRNVWEKIDRSWQKKYEFSFLGRLCVTNPTNRLACPSVYLSVRPSVCLSVRQHFVCKQDNSTNICRIGPMLIPWIYPRSVLVKFEDGWPWPIYRGHGGRIQHVNFQ